MAEAVAEEYRSSLCDLNFNSKPHINMLTMLAEENAKFAPIIVKTIVSHVKGVPPELKLPSLYLIDSIMKNIGGQYITLFCEHMITLFASVFEKVEETTRSALYKLRQTWNDILPKKILYGIDCNVSHIDPAWPITAKVTAAKSPIHVNPKFLGGPSNQPSNAPPEQGKPAIPKKPELGQKEKEVMEIKKKQDEMLRLIEEKKEQLKALEQKKLEMAAKQKKKTPNLTPSVVPQQPVQKKPVNHRDPRLKKSLPAVPVVNDKSNPIVLQSVVVVPNVKVPPHETSSNDVDESVKSVHKVNNKTGKPNIDSKPFHSEEAPESLNRRNENFQKKAFREVDEGKVYEKPTKEIHSDKPTINREHLPRTCKVTNKKHPLSPEDKTGYNSGKRFCKPPINKSKRLIQHGGNMPLEGHLPKKGRHEPIKSKNKHAAVNDEKGNKMFISDQRLHEAPVLFGTEDKDYRQHGRATGNAQSQQWHHPEGPPHSNARISQDTFYSLDHKVPEMPISDTNGKFFPRDGPVVQNPAMRRVTEEKFQTINMPDYDQDLIKKEKFIHSDHAHVKKLNERGSSPLLIKTENSDLNYNVKSIGLPNERMPPLPMKRFMLDGKNRNLYFVNEHAFVVMDDNDPREVTFYGPPRNVHIEGLSRPLLLGFDGKTHEFEIEGKRNTIRLGTPSREVYINNFPYEAQFGGPAFTTLLEDKKEHRILIEGPRPQVLCNKPSSELYELFLREIKGSQQSQIVDPNLAGKSPEGVTLLHDVDMRVKPSHVMKSSMLPESRKDVDWRQVPLADASKIPWEVAKSSFETDFDPSGKDQNFPHAQSNPRVCNAKMQWDGHDSRIGMHGEHMPERNKDIAGGPWPRPSFRPPMERPPFEPLHQPQAGPPKSWEVTSAPVLPPPPIPPNLNLRPPPPLPALSTVPTMPSLSVPPPTWNHPLPPPPMFPGQVPEKLHTTLSSSGLVSAASSIVVPAPPVSEPSVPTVSTLPINVETIFEKLVAAGIIPKKPTEDVPVVSTETAIKDENLSDDKKDSESKEEGERPEILFTPKSLKNYYPHVISDLYKGSQCATCGMRFKEIQSEQYSRHLDWHFRMNRREKDGAKKAYSRRLFYEIKDWIQFKEIEEAEERTPSYFELQADGDSLKCEEKEKIHSVPASECETEKCSVCGEQFQLFWVEEEEEWHLRHAVRHDGEAYHPMCYEDFKKAAELAKKAEEERLRKEEEERIRKEEEEKLRIEEEEKRKEEEEEERLRKEEEEKLAASVKQEPEERPETEIGSDDVKTEEESRVDEKGTADSDAVEVKVEGGEEEKMETESDQLLDEEKPVEEQASECEAAVSDAEKEAEDTAALSEPSESNLMEEEESVTNTVVPDDKSANLSSDIDSDNFEDDFRPPTPDPRFQVLPPVVKGNELSALCTIM